MKALFLLLFSFMLAVSARAEDFTTRDAQYLLDRFGVKQSEQPYTGMTREDHAALHDFIVDPWTRQYPAVRDARVQSKLVEIYNRECGAWAREHFSPACPPTSPPEMQSGKVIADLKCNMCHLFGTAETPPFFTLARAGGLTTARLTSALAAGHKMSPITLAPSEIDALLLYINGSK